MIIRQPAGRTGAGLAEAPSDRVAFDESFA